MAVEPGSDMKMTYEVTNDGQRPVFNVSVTDKITTENNKEVKDITASDPEKAKQLNPNETVEFTATIKAPEAGNKLHTDVAKAYGVPPSPTEPGKPGNPP
ncbi:NEW3 domain-containing protein, partial [Pseudomonas aeruginosa]